MSYDVRAVANYFLDKGRGDKPVRRLDHMKLQKLIYIAHGWHLAVAERPLIFNEIQAWAYGPVIPDLYHELKHYGARVIDSDLQTHDAGYGEARDSRLEDFAETVDGLEQTQEILDRVWDKYRHFDALQLSTMTHQEGTPWSQVHEMNGDTSALIGDDRIKAYYQDLASQNRAAEVRGV